MTRTARIAAVLVAAALPLLASCGLDCEEYCDKMAECYDHDNRSCDKNQCVDFCEHAAENDNTGFVGAGQCAIESSCNDLDHGDCYPNGNIGAEQWCHGG